MFKILYICFALILRLNKIIAEFSYDDVNEWSEQYPQFCSGSKQSPINIDHNSARSQRLQVLDLRDYVNKPLSSVNLTNSGHTVTGTFKEVLTITGGPVGSARYRLLQFHFHFGKGPNDGTEHAVNSQKYALEIHFVHQNLKYPDLLSALSNPDGVLVIGVLVTIDDRVYGPLSFVSDNLSKVQNAESTTVVAGPINLWKLLPQIQNGFDYYTYQGSLTTPNCNEVVTWVVNNQPLYLSTQEVRAFDILKNKEGHQMSGNIRPIQPKNGRTVTYVPAMESRYHHPRFHFQRNVPRRPIDYHSMYFPRW